MNQLGFLDLWSLTYMELHLTHMEHQAQLSDPLPTWEPMGKPQPLTLTQPAPTPSPRLSVSMLLLVWQWFSPSQAMMQMLSLSTWCDTLLLKHQQTPLQHQQHYREAAGARGFHLHNPLWHQHCSNHLKIGWTSLSCCTKWSYHSRDLPTPAPQTIISCQVSNAVPVHKRNTTLVHNRCKQDDLTHWFDRTVNPSIC